MDFISFPELEADLERAVDGPEAQYSALVDSFVFKPHAAGAGDTKAVRSVSEQVLGAAEVPVFARSSAATLSAQAADAPVDATGSEAPSEIVLASPAIGPVVDGVSLSADGWVWDSGGWTNTGGWTHDDVFADLGNWFYLSPTFADLDDDGDMDMVVGMWQGAVVALRNGTDGTIGNYQNWDGADPFAAVDVEAMATPGMTDLEGDGDLDLVVGNGTGEIHVYRNGTILTEGEYTEQEGDYPFAYVQGSNGLDIAFVDLDGDGDDDLVTGDGTGVLISYRNGTDGTRGNYLAWGEDDPFRNVSVEAGSTPAFIDLDADGDLDCVVGTRDGYFVSFRNGTLGTSGDFRPWITADPFAGISVGLRSDPAFADMDGDGDLDFVTGSYDFNLYAYENVAWPVRSRNSTSTMPCCRSTSHR